MVEGDGYQSSELVPCSVNSTPPNWMHSGPAVVAFKPLAGKVSLYAWGDVHRRSPTGDLANGIERKALAPSEHVVPRTFPAGIEALGAALTRARPETTKRESKRECICESRMNLDLERTRDGEKSRHSDVPASVLMESKHTDFSLAVRPYCTQIDP